MKKSLMTNGRRRIFPVMGLVVVAIGLAGCGGQKTPPQSASAQADRNDWALDKVKKAIALLNEGNPVKARKLLVDALEAQPGDMMARSLIKQIDTDPKQLLGYDNYRYTVKEGETMSSLAQKFLGDPMMAYALSRYNGLATPLAVQAGQSVLIPGKPKPAPQAKKAPPAAAPAAKKPAAVAKAAPPPKPAPQRTADPARAARLRGQGLAALNAGSINRAVGLFRQALAFDPANNLIRNDLARATRIQGSLSGRP
jgi:LysM repeat protein